MKNILLPLFAITLTAQASFGGNWLGSGPWANGAYYPGQFDGVIPRPCSLAPRPLFPVSWGSA